jgi:hypothetical protein
MVDELLVVSVAAGPYWRWGGGDVGQRPDVLIGIWWGRHLQCMGLKRQPGGDFG